MKYKQAEEARTMKRKETMQRTKERTQEEKGTTESEHTRIEEGTKREQGQKVLEYMKADLKKRAGIYDEFVTWCKEQELTITEGEIDIIALFFVRIKNVKNSSRRTYWGSILGEFAWQRNEYVATTPRMVAIKRSLKKEGAGETVDKAPTMDWNQFTNLLENVPLKLVGLMKVMWLFGARAGNVGGLGIVEVVEYKISAVWYDHKTVGILGAKRLEIHLPVEFQSTSFLELLKEGCERPRLFEEDLVKETIEWMRKKKIKTHSIRRSALRWWVYVKGLSLIEALQISMHSTLTTFLGYIENVPGWAGVDSD